MNTFLKNRLANDIKNNQNVINQACNHGKSFGLNRVCKECKFQTKLLKKQQQFEERKTIHEQYEREQNQIYEEVKRTFNTSTDKNLKVIRVFKDMEVMVEKTAEEYAKNYIDHVCLLQSQMSIYESCDQQQQQQQQQRTQSCVFGRDKNLIMESETTAPILLQTQDSNSSTETIIPSQGSSPSCSPTTQPVMPHHQPPCLPLDRGSCRSSGRSSDGGSPLLRFECLSALYKILLLPEDALQMYVNAQSSDVLQSEYKSLAKLIHPDKNGHPKARAAFQKLRKFWVENQRNRY